MNSFVAGRKNEHAGTGKHVLPISKNHALVNGAMGFCVVRRNSGCTMIVDAMSSFGGVDIPVGDWGIDFLISSANKCIQGVPGFFLL